MQTTTTSRGQRDAAPSDAAPWLRLLPEDGWLTLALLLVLVYTTIASIQGVGWGVDGLDILTWTTGVGLLLGYLAVQQGRLPSALVHVVALALGVGFAFKQTADSVVGGDRAALWDHVQIWFRQAIVQHGVSNDNVVFLLFLAILSFLLAYISVWLVLHTRRPWLAALANGVVLLINLNGATDDRALFFLVLYLLATLLLLVRFTLAENMRHWRARGLRFSPDLGWDFMQAGAIFAVVVLLFAYLLPAGNGTATLLDYWNSPNNPWQALQNTWANLFAGANGNGSGFGQLGIFGGNEMTLHGKVDLPNVVVLHYKLTNTTDDPNQYLMTATYDTYNGTNAWTSQLAQAATYEPFGIEQPSPGVQQGTLHTDTYAIVFQRVQGNHLFSPGSEPASFSVAADAFQNTSSKVPVQWSAVPQLVAGKQYYAQGYISAATADQLRQVQYPASMSDATRNGAYAPELLNEYLTTAGISPEVAQAAQDATKGTTNMYDAAVHLEQYLHTFTYSTDNPEPPAGQDAVAWFLHTQKGFCTFFASAMALMGRSIGMPTRVVLGFTKGSYDSQTHSYVVTGKDAHAWTQIYFANYGWINFEPTSSFDPFARALPGVGPGTPTPTGGPGANGTPSPAARATRNPDIGVPGSGGPNGPAGTALVDIGLSLSLIIVLVLVFAALFATWWRLLYRGLSPVTAAFARILRLGRWAGAPPLRSQTPDEYAEQLAEVIPGQRRALRRLSQLYATERWGGGLERERVAEVPRLYDQVRASTVVIIARRARHLPLALLRGVRRLGRRRSRLALDD